MSLFFKNIGFLANYTQIRTLKLTQICFAEPPRKKRRIDPAVLKMRVERKMKKVEREIARIERAPRHPIPLLEYDLNATEIRDLNQRPGHSQLEDPSMIKAAQKLWGMYRMKQNAMERRSLRQVIMAQDKALSSLKEIDEELYDRTVTADHTMIPYRASHIRKSTAPNPDYKPPDGILTNITRDWVM